MKQTLKHWLTPALTDSVIYQLGRELERLESVLDVGCGSNSPIGRSSVRPKLRVGIDGFLPSIESSRFKNLHDRYVQGSLLELEKHFEAESFDAVAAIDVIEHFEKPQGFELLRQMESIAKKKVMILTPNGFLEQGIYDQNEFQRHKSGWITEEFQKRGYRVHGVLGWKPLRGEYAKILHRPEKLWLMASFLSESWVYSRPKQAFALLAIKEK